MHSFRLFRHHLRLSELLFASVEGAIFAGAFILSFYLRWWSIDNDPTIETASLIYDSGIIAVVFVFVMSAMGLYESSLRDGLSGSLIRIALSLFLGSLILGALTFFFPQLALWRSVLVLTVCLSFISVTGLRFLLSLKKPEFFTRKALIYGDISIAEKLLDTDHKGLGFVGLVTPISSKPSESRLTIFPHEKSLLEIAHETRADEIVLALRDRRGLLPIDELLDCRMSGMPVLDLQDFLEREYGVVKLDMLTPSWLVHSDGFKSGAMALAIKRVLDISVSLIFLAFLWPVMLMTAIAIIMENGFRQPIIYRQVRIGENGRPFSIFKFRSMRVDAESDGKPRWATKNDSRITRVGSFIRKTRIDELPQIFNILKGEMSFVGPRPERPEFVVDFVQKHEYYGARFRFKPGLTGWAQIKHPYGNTENDALRKLEYDLYYIKNYSLFLDLLILVKTVEVVLFGIGSL